MGADPVVFPNMQKTIRESGVELYRIMLMFGICLLHSVIACGHTNINLNHLLLPCVDGFVLISGWFGVKFSWRKVGSLYLQAFYAAFIAECLIGDGGLAGVFFLVRRFWFLHAYIIMMMFAPLINKALESFGDDIKDALGHVYPS